MKDILTIYIGGGILLFVFIQFTINTGKSPSSDTPIKLAMYFMMFYQFAAVIAGWKMFSKITSSMFM
ncbi:hypothetical protein NWE55_09995 [Myroides albus]|uniref:Uncharacterized protein n=1 Tax=Myroides albus TaxID=2562892 RepID=A0A6I3LH37_9FLAO|nr:hypothetical protein [Myroides albus]MTG97114.1 hypothetical protein [Myroides albus]UVD78463.1 hypothetical protein NWE55_09995 [Myroides albus]